MDNNLIEISVRNLVEFVYKGGSIDNSFRDKDVMIEGIRAHQKMQNSRPAGFLSEVSVKYEFLFDEINFFIKGRCDGIYFDDIDDIYVIEEMKSTRVKLSEIDSDYNIAHFAQGKLYAYFYGIENDLDGIAVKLTYYNINDDKEKSFVEKYSINELKDFFEYTIKLYIKYAKLNISLKNKFVNSIEELEFPFHEYRRGQREMAVLVYRAISNKTRLFINAPTGIGKTVSTIFPSLKAMGRLNINKFFYITAKTITRTVAENTIKLFIEKGLDIRCIFITAKEKICFNEEINCNKDNCRFASGYYDRVNEGIYEILKNEKIINKDIICKYAREYDICPFEFSLDVSLYTEGVICDYNYIFDPRASLKRMNAIAENRILLVDEAHNLVDRTRDMFSATLCKDKVLNIRKDFKNEKTIFKKLSNINNEFLKIKKIFSESDNSNDLEKEISIPEKLIFSIQNFIEVAEDWLKKNNGNSRYKDFLEFYFECNSYIRIAKIYDENFTTIAAISNKELSLKLFCLNPADLIKEITLQNRATVFFSATLLPHNYFRKIFGEVDSDKSLILKSPFDPKNLTVSILPISTRYKDRKRTASEIGEKIHGFVNKMVGNYLVFFPSYAYMKEIYDVIINFDKSTIIHMQKSNMNEDEREFFLESFVFKPTETRIGFVTLGGIFSEGIDLTGTRLSGVIIVGVGIPQICFERELIKKFYDEKGKVGYDYSYTYPGMNKVLQGSGRLIRTESDRGELLLIGDRYLTSKYKKMIPSEWRI